MTRTPVNLWEVAPHILKSLSKGILLTTKADKANSMVIGWGHLGIEWGSEIFVVYVREHRYTKSQLDKTKAFTVNIPLETLDPQIYTVRGSRSGKEIDKEKEAGLTYIPSETIDVPAVKECPLTLECKVVFQKEQPVDQIDEQFARYYPQDVDGSYPMANQDSHTAYYGKILRAYRIED